MPTLDERIAALEARLGPAPLAVPPITIGELTNVPAPGSPIAAQWAQDVSSRVVQRFPTTAALKAWAAPPGAFAVALDSGVLWRRVVGGWAQQTPWQAGANGIYAQPGDTAPTTTASLTIPADPGYRTISATVFIRLRLAGVTIGYVDLIVDGQIVAQATAENRSTTDSPREYTLTPAYGNDLPINKAVPVSMTVHTNVGFTTECFADYWRHRLNVTVQPRGV